MIKAVLFDLDGTLIFSQLAIVRGIENTFLISGLTPPPVDKILHSVGFSMVEAFQFLGFPQPEKGVAIYRTFFIDHLSEIELNPDTIFVLEQLQSKGLSLGVVTNRKHSSRVIDHFALKTYFQTVVDLSRVNNPKPAPDPLLLALRDLKVEKEKVLYVGDSPLDVLAAKEAGVKIACLRGEEEKNSCSPAPDWSITSLTEILLILNES